MQDNDVNKINDVSQRMFFLEHDFDIHKNVGQINVYGTHLFVPGRVLVECRNQNSRSTLHPFYFILFEKLLNLQNNFFCLRLLNFLMCVFM